MFNSSPCSGKHLGSDEELTLEKGDKQMKPTATHKHVWVGGHVYSADFYNGKWHCNNGWGNTPREAVDEFRSSNLHDRDCEPTSVAEMHENEL